MYSNKLLIPVYKRDMLNIVAKELGMVSPEDATISGIQRYLIQQKGDDDSFGFYFARGMSNSSGLCAAAPAS